LARHFGHTGELAESSCTAKTEQWCRSRTFDKMLLFYGGKMQIGESISQKH
jgi:hypothetical protein